MAFFSCALKTLFVLSFTQYFTNGCCRLVIVRDTIFTVFFYKKEAR